MISHRPTLILAFVASAMFTTPTSAQSNASTFAATPLSQTQVRADIALLRQALEQVHSGYDRYAPRRVMDTTFARLDRRSETPMTDLQLYREVALLLARIRCNHTKAEYPKPLQTYRETHPTHLPFRVRVFGKRLFAATSVGRAIKRGTEIVGINGIRAADAIAALSQFVAVDGVNRLLACRAARARQ